MTERSLEDSSAADVERIRRYRAWRARGAPLVGLQIVHPPRTFWEVLSGKARPTGIGLAPGWSARVASDFIQSAQVARIREEALATVEEPPRPEAVDRPETARRRNGLGR
jgi:hypothetical protein